MCYNDDVRTIKGFITGYGVQIAVVGVATGAFAGVVVTLYNMAASALEGVARGYYDFFRESPAFIPLLLAGLALGGVVIGGVVRALPTIRGSGIPQTEGALRGLMRFGWFRALTGMFASSLTAIVLGLPAGAEGPSIMIGGMCGQGMSELTRRNALVRRFQITGGACAGLAVAFNAPLTGMIFAFEEGHRRFSPGIFACSLTSVIVAVIVRNALRAAFGLDTAQFMTTYALSVADLEAPLFYLFVLLASVVCAALGVAFARLTGIARRFFSRVTFLKGAGKFMLPFVLAGAAGLLTVFSMGGGREFISAMGSLSEETVSVLSSPLWASLLIVVAVRLVLAVLNMGVGVPCGAFVPMLAIGAGTGGLLAIACGAMGMDPAYTDALIVICMACFFTTVVRAPLTGIVMTFELTWNFAFLLPVAIGVAVGYFAGELTRTTPVYDGILDDMLVDPDLAGTRAYVRRLTVTAETAGKALGDIALPRGAKLTLFERRGRVSVPSADTVAEIGDVLTIEGAGDPESEDVQTALPRTGYE